MVFQMPVLVYQEADCVKKHQKELASFGRKALLVTGRSSAKKNGSLQDICDALKETGTDYCIFDEVEENPSIETVMKARELGIAEDVDFVIGIGGGSPLDAAKAIALMIKNREQEASFLYKKAEQEAALPVVAVPTTCGTGSEVTGVAVLTSHAKKTKASMTHKIYPALALIDAKYLETAPRSILCNTAVDALAHLIESDLNTNATDYSRMFVREGLRVWRLSKEVLLGKKEASFSDYENLMLASTYAGMAIAHTGTSLPHGLSYYVTYTLGEAHGKACGYFLPGYVREAEPGDRKRILRLTDFSSSDEFADFIRKVCRIEPLPQEILEKTVELVGANEAKLKNCPYRVDMEVLRRIAGL